MARRDRMDKLIAAAVRQGFQVSQNERGVWRFRKGIQTLLVKQTPETPQEWTALIGALRANGLRFPEED